MNYVKAKFIKEGKPYGKSYTYKTADEVQPGNIVVNSKGAKLMVMDEPVDAGWILVCGDIRVGIVKKYESAEVGESEE